jgi:hypothetical protein
MNYFDPAFHVHSPIEGSSANIVRAQIHAWITSTPFIDLLELFEEHIVLQVGLDETLRRLEAFSDRWDFRRIARENGAATDDKMRRGTGSARWLSATTGLSKEMEARILQDAKGLGLVNAQDPDQPMYDCILVLGGARLSCNLRPHRAAEVIRNGVRADTVALLGAARPVADSERDATDTYAPGAVDEFDLIVAGGRRAFGGDETLPTLPSEEERYDDPNNRNLSWLIRRSTTLFGGRPLRIVAISAPSSEPLRRRANSADTILFFLDREKVLPESRLLLITSQIYVPYVQLEALRTVALPRRMLVETIGFPGDRMPELQGLSNANHYLQEIRSAIQAARRFCQAYPV